MKQEKLKINGTWVEDTYCEAFDGLFSRILITAKNEKLLNKAALASTALPSTVFGESEGGIERFLSKEETPDGRKGAIVQIWVSYSGMDKSIEKLDYELGKRIRQGILVVPTTSVFDAPVPGTNDSKEKIDTLKRIGHCGDGYEEFEKRYEKEVINIPLMMGEFLIERYLSYAKGVMGGNVWFFCDSLESALKAGDIALDAVRKIDGIITPFDICSAGSKTETNYPDIGPTTNHPYCPTLKGNGIIKDSLVPDGVESIPEIVINGVSIDAVRDAMKAVILGVAGVNGVLGISAGNYGGKLGKYKIYLRDILE